MKIAVLAQGGLFEVGFIGLQVQEDIRRLSLNLQEPSDGPDFLFRFRQGRVAYTKLPSNK